MMWYSRTSPTNIICDVINNFNAIFRAQLSGKGLASILHGKIFSSEKNLQQKL